MGDNTYAPAKHHRHSVRLKGYDYSQAGAYFVTICTKNQIHYLGNIVGDRVELSNVGKIIRQFWAGIPNYFRNVLLDEYIIMPNHLHGIIMTDTNCRGGVAPPHKKGREPLPLQQKRPLGHVVGYFKYQSTKSVNEIRKSPGTTLWQRNYYERIVRNEDELNRIREYIINNPPQWQFDRENPRCISDKAYNTQWGQLEEAIYGKTKKLPS